MYYANINYVFRILFGCLENKYATGEQSLTFPKCYDDKKHNRELKLGRGFEIYSFFIQLTSHVAEMYLNLIKIFMKTGLLLESKTSPGWVLAQKISGYEEFTSRRIWTPNDEAKCNERIYTLLKIYTPKRIHAFMRIYDLMRIYTVMQIYALIQTYALMRIYALMNLSFYENLCCYENLSAAD
uniref:Uncharacterized protein n=1 Tax=Glossina brevipalpis TaxID=37001 RepID=A0A1A9WZL7_9MUSC